MNDSQYQRAASGFDRVAEVYDSLYGAEAQNAAVRRMKAENWAIVSAELADCRCVLELGCGTGEDAAELARAGKTVVATDISPEMAQATANRAAESGVTDRIFPRVAAAGRLEPIVSEFGTESFDGIYAGFSLTYEPDMNAVSREVEALLRSDGKLVIAALSRSCAWEMGWLIAHGHPFGAFRRWRRWTKAQIGAGQKILAQHYAPVQLARYFRSGFVLQRVAALSLILPPPFLDPLYQQYQASFDRLIPLEQRIREWPLLNGWGNAFVAIFQRL